MLPNKMKKKVTERHTKLIDIRKKNKPDMKMSSAVKTAITQRHQVKAEDIKIKY